MRNFIFSYLFGLYTCSIYSQINLFNLTPSIPNGINEQSIFHSVSADSNYLYVLGDYPYISDSILGITEIQSYFAKFNYLGEKLFQKNINIEPNSIYVGRKSLLQYNKKRNTYYHIVILDKNKINSRTNSFWTLEEISLDSGTPIQQFLIDSSFDLNSYLSYPYFDYDGNNAIRICGYLDPVGNKDPHFYLIELDTNFKVKFVDSVSINGDRYVPVKIKTSLNGESEVIAEKYSNSFKYDGTYYLKIGKKLEINKIKRANISSKFLVGRADRFSYHKLEIDNSWVFFIEYIEDTNASVLKKKPYVIKMSEGFDSVMWLRQMYDEKFPDSMIHSETASVLCSDGSGIIVCGDIDRWRSKQVSYGLIFKVGLNGDSLWLRKIVPINFDSLQSGYMYLYPMVETPYRTFVAVGSIADSYTWNRKPWLLHFDTHGCFIPGCEKTVSTKDIEEGKTKAFELYPNPVLSERLYLLSRINTNEEAYLSLIDLQGKVVKSMKLKLEKDVQYIINIPEDIPTGEYIFRIASKKYLQNNKVIISK